MQQRTILNQIEVEGVGLHTGQHSNIILKPAEVDTGIVFRRVDLGTQIDIRCSPDKVGETKLCTTIVQNISKIATIEHLMSALAGLGIDNIYVDVSTDEIPILDGSAARFVFIIQAAGIKELDQPKKFNRIKKQVRVENDIGGWAMFEPYEGYKLSFGIDFSHSAFKNTSNYMEIEFSTISYLYEVSRARTFGFLNDVKTLQAQKLALGASLNNAIGIDDKGVVNVGGLRNKDEFVRHKILDAVGDLYIAGYTFLGHYSAYKSGHELNNKLVRKIYSDNTNWEEVTFSNKNEVPINFDSSAIMW